MPRRTENGNDDDFTQYGQKYTFKEPFVLVGLICLTVLYALNKEQQSYGARMILMQTDALRFSIIYSVSGTAAPVLGTVALAFLSEITGRKPIIITLFLSSIMSAALSAVMQFHAMCVSLLIQGLLVSGGTPLMTFLAISEYCCPKHRFAYLMANTAASLITFHIVHGLYSAEVLDTTSVTIQIVTIILGIAGLASVWVWPESPHWLASQGRIVESKKAFLWLRGEQSEAEFRALKQEQRRPGPPQLYCLTLLISIAAMSISHLYNFQDTIVEVTIQHSKDFIDDKYRKIIYTCCTIVGCFILVLLSYKISRRVLVAVGSVVPLLLCYVVVVWQMVLGDKPLYGALVWVYFIVGILRKIGPGMLGMAVFIETIPLKYNTHMTCVCFVFYYAIKTLYGYLLFEILSRAIVVTLLLTSLSLCAVILFYFLSKEPKDKTLLEIQKLYTPNENVTNVEPATMAMEQVQNDKDHMEV